MIFFYFYYNSGKDLKVAIPPLIVATIASVLFVWVWEKKIPMVPLLSGILVTLFGGLTIYFKNPIFIYMKPTIINILFALALFFGKYFTNEPMLKKILGKFCYQFISSLDYLFSFQIKLFETWGHFYFHQNCL